VLLPLPTRTSDFLANPKSKATAAWGSWSAGRKPLKQRVKRRAVLRPQLRWNCDNSTAPRLRPAGSRPNTAGNGATALSCQPENPFVIAASQSILGSVSAPSDSPPADPPPPNRRAFWDQHPGLVWSNRNAPDDAFISAALRKNRFLQLLDIAREFGPERLRRQWQLELAEGDLSERIIAGVEENLDIIEQAKADASAAGN